MQFVQQSFVQDCSLLNYTIVYVLFYVHHFATVCNYSQSFQQLDILGPSVA